MSKTQLCTNIFVATVSILLPLGRAQKQSTALSLNGFWLTSGYGELMEFHGNDLQIYEITKLSCRPSEKASRDTKSRKVGEVVFANEDDTFHLAAGPSQDTLWLHEDGAVQNILLRRTSSRPKPCGQPLADTPLMNYEVFWETFAEQYAFFNLRKVDWRAMDKKNRKRVKPDTKPEELLQILSGMVEPLHDKHVYIYAPALQKGFRGGRPPTDSMQEDDKPRITEIIETNYIRGGLRDFCNGQLQFGRLRLPRSTTTASSERRGQNDFIGYLRILSFARFAKGDGLDQQLDALQTALDEIFANASRWGGLIIDIRINIGGFDQLGLAIASRLASKDYFAWEKFARSDVHDQNRHTAPQSVMVEPGTRSGFRGPVVLLTSAHGISAAETFTMALLGRDPHVTRVGANTQGVFSDELARRLPNGWRFALSNEAYRTKDGRTFEGTGVPPDFAVPIFPKEDLNNGRDSALDKALTLLVH